jgi:hypothetical protein
MQKTDNQVYREQRRIPKNTSPQESDNHAGKIKFVEAPRAHEMTRRYIHDCEYAGINEIRAGVREATRLKKNLYSNVIPFKTKTESGKGKAALRPSTYNAEQGPSTRRKPDSRDNRDRQSRDSSHWRLAQRNPSPPASQNRYADSDGTVFSGDPARDRATNSGPMADNNFRERYDNSLRDKSMSSDRSRDSRPREATTESIGPYRNRDPRARDAQLDRSYPSFRETLDPMLGAS